MRKILSILLGISLAGFTPLHAQNAPPPPPPMWGVAIGAGLNFTYTDVKPTQPSPDFSATFLIQPIRSVQVGLGLHAGSLKARVNEASGRMGFTNRYLSPAVTLRFFPVALSPNKEDDLFLSLASGLFIGAGVAILNSNVSAARLWRPDYGSYGDFTASNLMYLGEIGYQYPIARIGDYSRLSVMAHFRLNFAQYDKVDGYMPLPAGVSDNDAYNTLGLALVWSW